MKVKKLCLILFAVVCVCGFTACEKSTSEQAESTTSVHIISGEVTQASTSETEQTTAATEPLPVYDESCSAKITRFAISADNKYMISPIEYEINQENKTIAVSITYENYADIHTLQNSRFVTIARRVRDGESAEVDTSKAILNEDALEPDWSYIYDVAGN